MSQQKLKKKKRRKNPKSTIIGCDIIVNEPSWTTNKRFKTLTYKDLELESYFAIVETPILEAVRHPRAPLGDR